MKYTLLVLSVFLLTSCLETEKAAEVDFVTPKHGDVVRSPVKLEFQVTGMQVQPAGKKVENTGHHHVIVNGAAVPEGQLVPADETHIHFGKGQTSTMLDLKPGRYTLTLQFADGFHQSYGPKLAKTISVTVQ